MRSCTVCGAALPDDACSCPRCGAEQPSPQGAAPSRPFYTGVEQPEDRPLTTGEYLCSLILFALPVAGLIALLYCSFSCSVLPARRSLARAYLIRSCLFWLMTLAAFLTFFLLTWNQTIVVFDSPDSYLAPSLLRFCFSA